MQGNIFLLSLATNLENTDTNLSGNVFKVMMTGELKLRSYYNY